MMLVMFRNEAKKKRAHSLPCDPDYEVMQGWNVLQEEWKEQYGMNRRLFEHLNARSNMTLEEFVKTCYASFALFQTERERLDVWLNIGTLLCYDTKENQDLGVRPFSSPLRELHDKLVEEEVRTRVAKELRIEELKRQSDAIKG